MTIKFYNEHGKVAHREDLTIESNIIPRKGEMIKIPYHADIEGDASNGSDYEVVSIEHHITDRNHVFIIAHHKPIKVYAKEIKVSFT